MKNIEEQLRLGAEGFHPGRIRVYRLDEQQRQQVLKAIHGVLRTRPEVLFAFVYGSFHEERAFRDVDLGVFLKAVRKTDYPDYAMDLSLEIEGKLDKRFPVDTRVINEAPLSFRFRVLRGLPVFSRDDGFLSEYMAQTARAYLDFSPLRNLYLSEAIK